MNVKNEIIKKIKSARTIAIFMHDSPDGDCMGSAVALEETCKMLNKNVELIVQDRIPKRFSPIMGEKRVEKIIMPKEGKMYDLAILVDCADPKRTVPNLKKISKTLIVIDHHPIDKPYGDLYLYSPVAATGMIIFDIIKSLVTPTTTIATAIYFSIVSDTGGFKNDNMDSNVHRVCSELMDMDADIKSIKRIFETKSLSFVKLLGCVLKNVQLDKKYKITTLMVTRDQIKESGASDNEVAMLIDYIRDIDSSDISFLFIEGYSNIRVRARSNFSSVKNILSHFGGGGHEKAAGCAIDSINIEYVKDQIVSYTKKYIDNTHESG